MSYNPQRQHISIGKGLHLGIPLIPRLHVHCAEVCNQPRLEPPHHPIMGHGSLAGSSAGPEVPPPDTTDPPPPTPACETLCNNVNHNSQSHIQCTSPACTYVANPLP